MRSGRKLAVVDRAMPKNAKPKSNYPPELHKPIVLNPGTLMTGLKDVGAQLAEQKTIRLALLLKHYSIGMEDPQMWPKLAMRLAEEHIDGFKHIYSIQLKHAGRPNLWTTGSKGLELYLHVQRKLAANPGLAVEKAVGDFGYQPPRKSHSMAPVTKEEYLRKCYRKAVDEHPMVQLLENMREKLSAADYVNMLKEHGTGLITAMQASEKSKNSKK
jgi:hypothetical protein